MAEKVSALEATCAALYDENTNLKALLQRRHSAMSNIRQSLVEMATPTKEAETATASSSSITSSDANAEHA